YPGESQGTIVRPVSVTIRRPIGSRGARVPAMAVVGYVLPVAVGIEVVDAGYLGVLRYVFIARGAPVIVVIVGWLTFVRVVVAVAPAIFFRIAIRIVVVDDGAGGIRREVGGNRFRVVISDRQGLSSVDFA